MSPVQRAADEAPRNTSMDIIETNPARAEQKRQQRDNRYHVIQLPALRLLGSSILAIFVLLHNIVILDLSSWELTLRFITIISLYCLISWVLIYLFHPRLKCINVGNSFLYIDIVFFVLAIYYSGDVKSLLFFIPIVRAADQTKTKFKNVVLMAHMNAVCYLGMVLYLVYVDHKPVYIPSELLKVVLIYGTSLYLSMTARTAEMLRNRTREAIRTSRDLIRQLREKSAQLADEKSKAEAANRAKSQFLANMSHEIRTPINGVLGMTELLLNAELTDRQRHFANTVHNSGELLLAVINDILDFSKIEAGKLELEHVDFPLHDTIEEVAGLLAEHAHRKGLELACFIHPHVPLSVCGDSVRLRQILTNLLSNAIKFTDTGEVVIRVAPVAEETALLHFEVRDTGMGIPPEAQRRIFAAFSQADGSTTRTHGGTGLGLAIVKQLVDMMGGTLGVESTSGEGSTFWFTAHLPATLALVQSQSEGDAALRQRHVLVVDDNATNRTILQHQTEMWGMSPDSATNGPQALEMLSSAAQRGMSYDLAIIDMHMPGMDGLELARAIKSDPAIANLRLVMLTSGSVDGDTDAAQQAGIERYLHKPVRQSLLYHCLVTLLGATPAGQEVATAHAAAEHRGLDGRVLLAEDNPVNQEVAIGMIEHFGCHVDVVSNGREAVEALDQGDYDVVFMDCQMPELDGFEATRQIRAEEKKRTHTPIPIIALTAHALEGIREQCLTAGMDDYLTKPFLLADLHATLARWLPHQPSAHLESEPSHAPLDVAVLEQLAALGGNGKPGIVEKIVNLYLQHAPQLISDLHEAIKRGDAASVRFAAHSLKSSSFNVGALALADQCEELEVMGRTHALADASGKLAKIESEHARVQEALQQILEHS